MKTTPYVAYTRLCITSMITTGALAMTACGQATDATDDEGDDGIILIEDTPGDGGQTTPDGCAPDAIETTPPGQPRGCYDLCEATGACDAGLECRSFNAGTLEICVPTPGPGPGPDPDPDPEPEPACPADETLTQLSYVDDPVCLRSCDPSAARETCAAGTTCLEVTGDVAGVCGPNASLTLTQTLYPTGGVYSAAADDLGRVHVFYGNTNGTGLYGLLGDYTGAFGEPTLVTDDGDDSNVDNVIGDMKVTTGQGGRVGLVWNVSSVAGFVPNAYFGMSKYWAQFGPGAGSGIYDTYALYSASGSDYAENFDASFAGTQLVIGANNTRDAQIEYGTPGSRHDVWTPVRDIADLTLTHDPSGGGHMVYADGFNGFVYQYLPAVSGGGVIEDTRKLADQDTDNPAGLDAVMTSTGVLGVHMTYWNNPDSEFCTGSASTPGGELTAWSCVDLTNLFGASPLDNAVTYSDLIGWVVCGGTGRGLECVGLSDSDRPLPQTLVTSAPRRDPNDSFGGSYSLVQAVSTPDGAVHVFWIGAGDERGLNHAVIR